MIPFKHTEALWFVNLTETHFTILTGYTFQWCLLNILTIHSHSPLSGQMGTLISAVLTTSAWVGEEGLMSDQTLQNQFQFHIFVYFLSLGGRSGLSSYLLQNHHNRLFSFTHSMLTSYTYIVFYSASIFFYNSYFIFTFRGNRETVCRAEAHLKVTRDFNSYLSSICCQKCVPFIFTIS